jgi:hypothetical protein
VVANAGGIHPQGCAAAVQALAASMADQLPRQPRVAVVLGDDVLPQLPALRASGVCSATGQPLPLALALALALGADIVITGRVVDSAVTLGPLMHEFGWTDTDWDRLAGGSLAGHIIECGCQATGGLHTDWQSVPDWPHMGYPIVHCSGDGSFVLTKAKGTGGLVHPTAVAEQLLYEIGDPGAYLLPDVYCDFRAVQLQALGADRVRVSGAHGRAPGGSEHGAIGTDQTAALEEVRVPLAFNGIDEAVIERPQGGHMQLGAGLGQGALRDRHAGAVGAHAGKEGVECALDAGTTKAQQGRQQRGQRQLARAGEGLGVIGAAGQIGKGRAVQVIREIAQDALCKTTVLRWKSCQPQKKTNKINGLQIVAA